jgi:quinoprotein glucose dehydrogenase
MDFVVAAGGGGLGANGLTVQGLPIVRPPWGRITAIDLNKGEIVWQVAHGQTLDTVRNHPALKGVNIPRTGQLGPLGTLTTKTLVISGESAFTTMPSGQRGAMLRAYDKATGQDVAEVFMPAPQTGTPMTYMLNGKQYLVVAVGGAGVSAELIAYTLQ